MKERYLEDIKKRLRKEKRRLEKTLSRFAKKKPESQDDWEAQFPKMKVEASEDRKEDAAKMREEYETRRSVEQTLELKLKKIRKALERIKGDKYGRCTNCGKKIGKQRLEAVPEAELCRECKEAG